MKSFYGILVPIQIIYSSGQCVYPKNSIISMCVQLASNRWLFQPPISTSLAAGIDSI